jgi:hypothetical protein
MSYSNSDLNGSVTTRKSIETLSWFALGVFFIAPLFFMTYYQDDRVFVLSSEFSKLTLWDGTVAEIMSWLKDGRFTPVAVFVRHAFFYVFSYQSAWLYHLVILILSGAAFYIFLKLIRFYEFKGSALIFFLLFIALTQFRVTAPDPIIGYNALVQVTIILVCAALICIEIYFRSQEKKYFILGVLFALVSVLYYEIAVFLLAAPVVMYLYKYQFKKLQKPFIWYALFYISLVLIFAVFRAYLKSTYAMPEINLYPGTELDLNVKNVLTALFFQVSGSLPLSYIAYFFARIFGGHLLIVAISVLACIFVYIKRTQIVLLNKNFLFFSLVIILGAATPVALSKHHSSWVAFGYPYIPVFIQNLAVASILAALVSNNRAVRALLFLIILVSSIPNYVLFHELDKKDGPIRMVVDVLGSQNYPITTKFDKTFISEDGNREGNHEIDLGFLQEIAKTEFGEIHYTKLGETLYEKGVASNVILLSKSRYKNMLLVMGSIEVDGDTIKNPVYVSPNRACIEQLALDKSKIAGFKTHRETMLYAYPDSAFYRIEGAPSCKSSNNWYDHLMEKLVPKH